MGSSSLTRDWTQASCIGNSEFWPLDHQGSSTIFKNIFFCFCDLACWGVRSQGNCYFMLLALLAHSTYIEWVISTRRHFARHLANSSGWGFHDLCVYGVDIPMVTQIRVIKRDGWTEGTAEGHVRQQREAFKKLSWNKPSSRESVRGGE